MSISLKEVADTCKVEALLYKITNTEASDWRYFCRQYSKKFNTPLHLVLDMEPEFVILHVFESQIEDVDPLENIQEFLDKVLAVEDPNYEVSQEEELQDFIKEAEEEEAARIKSGKPVHKALANEPTLSPILDNSTLPKKKSPTGGSVKFEDSGQEE